MLPRRPGYLGPGSLRGFLPPKRSSRRLLDSKYLQNTQASTIDAVWVIFLRRPTPANTQPSSTVWTIQLPLPVAPKTF